MTQSRQSDFLYKSSLADTDAPPGARVRAATALMDRAGLTACLRGRSPTHRRPRPATSPQPQVEDAEKLARDILRVLPQVVAVLPADEVRSPMSQIKSFLV
jgi:hypothetical protein